MSNKLNQAAYNVCLNILGAVRGCAWKCWWFPFASAPGLISWCPGLLVMRRQSYSWMTDVRELESAVLGKVRKVIGVIQKYNHTWSVTISHSRAASRNKPSVYLTTVSFSRRCGLRLVLLLLAPKQRRFLPGLLTHCSPLMPCVYVSSIYSSYMHINHHLD